MTEPETYDADATTAKTRAVFDTASDLFDAPPLSFFPRLGTRLVEIAQVASGERVLDACCGTGAVTVPAAQAAGASGQVLGIDLSDGMLAHARRHTDGLAQVELRTGNLLALDVPDGAFDVVLCGFGVFFVDVFEEGVRELWRAVRPGGRLAISTWGPFVLRPLTEVFYRELAAVRPELVPKSMRWARIIEPDGLFDMLVAGGVPRDAIELTVEHDHHRLHAPDDAWTIVRGTGLREIVERLTPDEHETVRDGLIHGMMNGDVHQLDSSVHYVVARKPG